MSTPVFSGGFIPLATLRHTFVLFVGSCVLDEVWTHWLNEKDVVHALIDFFVMVVMSHEHG